MDLSFTRFEADTRAIALPPDLAVMLVGVTARQAASPTAMTQMRLSFRAPSPAWFAPEHGCFNAAVATALTRWQQE